MKLKAKQYLKLICLFMLLGCGDGNIPEGIEGTWVRSATREHQCSDHTYDQANDTPICLGGGPCPTYVFTSKEYTYTDPRNGVSKSGTYTYSGDRLTLTDQTGGVDFRVSLTASTLSFFTNTNKSAIVFCVLETKYARK